MREAEFRLPDEEATRRLGRAFGEHAVPGLVLLLFGELGAGKTTFVQGLAMGLGSTTRASSPTFNLIHLHSGRLPLLHADLYRLDDEAGVEDLGLAEEVEEGAVAAIEWPELALEVLSPERLEVEIRPAPEGGRTASVRASGEVPEAVLEEVARAYPGA